MHVFGTYYYIYLGKHIYSHQLYKHIRSRYDNRTGKTKIYGQIMMSSQESIVNFKTNQLLYPDINEQATVRSILIIHRNGYHVFV